VAAGRSTRRGTTVARHFDRLYRFFDRHVDDGIADLVQRTWMACVHKRDRIPDQAGFGAFLFGVARKELAMDLRKRHRGARALSRMEGEAVEPPTPSEILCAREHGKLLRWALRRIPPDSRLVLDLFYWEELGVDAVAEVLEIAPGTVKSRLHRAREQLRAAMATAGAASIEIDTTLLTLEHAVRSAGLHPRS
jgi:RNA polymerase sigma-70 factor (ECF subfamily)